MVTFNDRVPYEPPDGETTLPVLLTHTWYLDRYASWTVAEASDSDEVGGHPGHWEPHRHAITRLIARRPLTRVDAR